MAPIWGHAGESWGKPGVNLEMAVLTMEYVTRLILVSRPEYGVRLGMWRYFGSAQLLWLTPCRAAGLDIGEQRDMKVMRRGAQASWLLIVNLARSDHFSRLRSPLSLDLHN